MANTAISGFTTAAPTDNDVVPFAQSPFGAGTNRKFTLSGLATYLKTALGSYFSGGGPNYVSGTWYNPHGPNAVNVNGQPAAAAGDIAFLPISVPAPITIKAMGVRVQTVSAGGLIALGIYANNPTANKPTGTPLTSVTGLSTTTGTAVSANLATPLTLQPGIYWLAIQADNTVATLAVPSNTTSTGGYLVGSSALVLLFPTATSIGGQSLFQTGTYPTLPDQTALTPSPSAGNKGGAVGFQIN